MIVDNGSRNLALATTFVDELARAGVEHAVVCPGSRSTPLALALARQAGIRIWVLVDERSAAFFALGMARASGRPVAILCSSGTAAANFLPAVVEANLSRVPLIVLTADRPPELRDFGAAQTIDQIRLYGGHVKWFADMPVPEPTDDLLRHARVVARRAVVTALAGPAGPVHLNFPFREPLLPGSDEPIADRTDDMPDRAEFVVSSAARVPGPDAMANLASELATRSRGVIVCGPQDDPALAGPVARLAAALGYPILADALSQVRCGGHDRSLVIDDFDAFLRDDATAAELAPEVILRFGAIPTSKPLLQFMQRHGDSRHILIDGGGGWRDPMALATDVIHADPGSVCDALVDAVVDAGRGTPTDWTATWLEVAAATREAMADRISQDDETFEGRVFTELADLVPDGTTVFAGNSMPVRDLDTFFPASDRAVRCLSNRGANGIDGVVSTALGVAAANDGPVVLVIGDLSFYHDLNGLLAAKKYGLRGTIVVLNNDGGGIFSFLPQATQVDEPTFEALFGTPIGLDVEAAAGLYGAAFARPGGWAEFRAAVVAGIEGDGLTVVEVITDRARNVAQHRAVWAAVRERLRQRTASGVA